MGKANAHSTYVGNEPDRPRPSAGIRAQDSPTWTRGQSCPRSNNASADAMKIAKRTQASKHRLETPGTEGGNTSNTDFTNRKITKRTQSLRSLSFFIHLRAETIGDSCNSSLQFLPNEPNPYGLQISGSQISDCPGGRRIIIRFETGISV